MTNYYSSEFYNKPIEVDNIEGEILVTITDNSARKIIYSWYDIIAKNSHSNYITKCLLGGFINKIPRNVLIIGFGGGAFCKYLEDHIKDIQITGIDIDKTMFEIAKKELKVKTDDFLIMDGNEAIEKLKNDNKKFNLILIDVYGNEGTIPESFINKLTYENIGELLNKDGIISINLADYNNGNQENYNKIHNYLKEIFGENFIHILAGENDNGNISGIYNLEKKYDSEEIILKYLEKVKNGEILYDSNMIKNIFLS